jgi:hypothetical protein
MIELQPRSKVYTQNFCHYPHEWDIEGFLNNLLWETEGSLESFQLVVREAVEYQHGYACMAIACIRGIHSEDRERAQREIYRK